MPHPEMTEQERENLQTEVKVISQILQALDQQCLMLESRNPRLSIERMYLKLLENIRESHGYADELADYIEHATAENWLVAEEPETNELRCFICKKKASETRLFLLVGYGYHLCMEHTRPGQKLEPVD